MAWCQNCWPLLCEFLPARRSLAFASLHSRSPPFGWAILQLEFILCVCVCEIVFEFTALCEWNRRCPRLFIAPFKFCFVLSKHGRTERSLGYSSLVPRVLFLEFIHLSIFQSIHFAYLAAS